MDKFNLSNLLGTAKDFTIKHSPEILTGIGIAGLVSTSVITGKATLKASRILEEERENREEAISNTEMIKLCWRPYIPAVVIGAMSISCIIFASSQNYKRNAALATAYSISEAAFREYKDKVVEVIGEKKEKTSIRDAMAKDKIEAKPVDNNEIIMAGKGQSLCYDSISGRYFKSDIEDIRSACNRINSDLIKQGYISLNDFYYEIGMEPIKQGELMGWNFSKDDLVELNFSSQLATDGTPCLVLDYNVTPKYDYNMFG